MVLSLNEIILYLLIFLSELIGTLVVFGSSAFFLPISITILTKNQSLGLMGFFQVISNIFKATYFIKKVDWRIALMFGVPSIIMVAFGSQLTARLDTSWFKIGLGLTLIFLLVLECLKHFQLPKNSFVEMIGGVISGFISGLIGTGGAVRGYFIFSFHLPKEVLIGTYCFIDFTGDLVRLMIYWQNGFVDGEFYKLIPGAIFTTLTANILGLYFLNKIPLKYFKLILMITLFILSLTLLLNL